MKIFADFHHDDLFHSLHLLFEKRLNWELYAPIGMDWYVKGYWRYSYEPRVVRELLSEDRGVKDCGDYCLVDNPCHERKIKSLTFEQFKNTKIDIIITSIPKHVLIYKKLRDEFQPKAKIIQQVGNEWKDFDYSVVKNLMVSCAPFKIPKYINTIFYHQEFDLDLFNFEPGDPKAPIKSFVNDLPNLKDWKLFQRYEKALPQWKWKSHGLGCRDGNIRPLKSLVKEMKDSSFLFHAKSLGDGFGHIIHNIFALGRVPIVRGKWYKGRAAEALIDDLVTCIDLDKHSFKDNLDWIDWFSRPDEYRKLCKSAAKRFRKVVNYDQEFFKIKNFLRKLQ